MWRRFRMKRSVCSLPRSWAVVRQKTLTAASINASRSAGRRRIASSWVGTIQSFKPAARSPSTMLFPRLRSTKNSGGSSFREDIAADYPTRRPRDGASGRRSGCDSDHVRDLIGRDAEISRNLFEGVSSLESIDQILDTGSALGDQRQAKGDLGIDDHLGVCIGRQTAPVRPPLPRRGDAPSLGP